MQAPLPPSSMFATGPVTGTPVPTPATFEHAHRGPTQWKMAICIAISYVIFWWVGDFFSIPAIRGFGGSLLKQPAAAAVLSLLVAGVLLIAITFVVEWVASRYWYFAGPLAASAGLCAWSFRGGSSVSTLVSLNPTTAGNGIFYLLAAECLMLGGLFAGVWFVLHRFFHLPKVKEQRPFSLIPDVAVAQVVLTQAVVMAIGILILVPNPEKKQVIFGVLIASAIASGTVRYFYNNRIPEHWCWAAPILVGVLGFLINSFDPTHLAVETGQVSGTFGALARPLPLDYAGAGVFGALIGLGMTSDDWSRAGGAKLELASQ